MKKKYEFVPGDTIEINGHALHRIRAVVNFGVVYVGAIGGYIETDENLSHNRMCWVSADARVYNGARIFGDSWALGNVEISGPICIGLDALIDTLDKVYSTDVGLTAYKCIDGRIGVTYNDTTDFIDMMYDRVPSDIQKHLTLAKLRFDNQV